MPIYEYQCEVCHETIEAWQSLSDAPLKTCPKCSGTLRKLISMSSFQLKGGGWYADGYCSTSGGCGKPAPSTNSADATDSAPKCGGGQACKGC